MAKLTLTNVAKFPAGQGFMVVGTASITQAANATEWISAGDLGLKDIVAGGITPQGTALGNVNVVLNAEGTGVAEGVNPGSLGVECSATAKLSFWVVGRGSRGVSGRKVASA